MLNFYDIFYIYMIFILMNQKNNILFLFWTTLILLMIMLNFYLNYGMGLVSILTGHIFIGGLLVFFMYSMLLFYNNFNYMKKKKGFLMFFVMFFLMMNNNTIMQININYSIMMLDFNNWFIFFAISFTFLYLIFLCFNISKEKFL
uniref:NADH dehydrogenase subunit 6 n=1 Tax=Didemnum vexillum TaxID=516032 RepID=A0A0A7LK38_9ASCI|nr:NADH dehydrogenase subunit 6 [Didemnum vexillum]AIZ58128.1 NADH dehydrogenase subunit 6 [Didemnum vexillum]UYK51632.1 NADH dehydrogenase subunit 6 [Didemnum vexillum]